MIRYVSFIDLLSFEESKRILIEGDEGKFYTLLHSIGFDINLEIEHQECYHRPMITNDVFFGVRVVGSERTDEEWVRSGYCTMENRMEIVGKRDVYLLKDMLEMTKTTCFTKMIIDHIEGV